MGYDFPGSKVKQVCVAIRWLHACLLRANGSLSLCRMHDMAYRNKLEDLRAILLNLGCSAFHSAYVGLKLLLRKDSSEVANNTGLQKQYRLDATTRASRSRYAALGLRSSCGSSPLFIIMPQQGQVTEVGTRSELLDRGGLIAGLGSAQQRKRTGRECTAVK